jgi:hypothetical protein
MSDTAAADHEHGPAREVEIDRKLHVSPRRWFARLAAPSLFA